MDQKEAFMGGRNALARAMWRVENRDAMPEDAEGARQAFLEVREHYVAKANQIITQLAREDVKLEKQM